MAFERDLATFLEKYQIDRATFDSADISWDALIAIAEKKEADEHKFRTTAETISNYLQSISAVHSVRWRVKNTEHLIEKIIRKRIEKPEKYSKISHENYSTIIKDIVGIRALHLYKGDYAEIDHSIRGELNLDTSEKVVVYTREGDNKDQYDKDQFEPKTHDAGYRSIHYIFSSKIFKQEIFCELQVRTLFEEGWSEIDHKVRYPNFTEDPLINEFLLVFNRLCGSADDMGTFVQNLVSGIKGYSSKIHSIREKNQDDLLKGLNATLKELEDEKNENIKKSIIIKKLTKDIEHFKEKTKSSEEKNINIFNEKTSNNAQLTIGDFIRSINEIAQISNQKRNLKIQKETQQRSNSVGSEISSPHVPKNY